VPDNELVEPNKKSMHVEAKCSLCNIDIPGGMILGERVTRLRYHLAEPAWCEHCELWLNAAIQDHYGRYWGRREVFNAS